MNINTNSIVSMTEANQNFSKVAKVAEKNGEAVIFKNNKPKFVLIDMETNPYMELTDDEKIDVIAARILKNTVPHLRSLQNDKIHMLSQIHRISKGAEALFEKFSKYLSAMFLLKS